MTPEELPALLGGRPVQSDGPPAWPLSDDDVLAALQSAYASGNWGAYHGENLPRLEELLRQHFQSPHVFTTASGTLATEVALRALGVSAGDEVIMGAYDYEPNLLTVLAIGAKPVLIDCRPDSPVLDERLVSSAITPRTKAILASHLHGGMVAMPALRAVAGTIPIVEDAAQAAGGTVDGKPAGSLGDAGVISFGGSKLLSAGRGGAVFFREAGHAQRAKVILSRGVQQWGVLSELQATVLIPQLAKLAERTHHRHQMAEQLHALIAMIPALKPIVNHTPCVPGYYKLGFYLDEEEFGLGRESFVKALRAEGIAFDAGFRPVHQGRSPGRFIQGVPLTHADQAGRQMVMLHHPVLSGDASGVARVAGAVGKTHRFAGRLA